PPLPRPRTHPRRTTRRSEHDGLWACSYPCKGDASNFGRWKLSGGLAEQTIIDPAARGGLLRMAGGRYDVQPCHRLQGGGFAVDRRSLWRHWRTLAQATLYSRRKTLMTKPGATLAVRTAVIADAPSVAAIGRVAFPAVHNDVVGPEFAAVMVEQTYSIEALTECITRCTAAIDAEFLVAEKDGEVIGYLHYDSEGPEPELHRIYVDPGRKRGGVG